MPFASSEVVPLIPPDAAPLDEAWAGWGRARLVWGPGPTWRRRRMCLRVTRGSRYDAAWKLA